MNYLTAVFISLCLLAASAQAASAKTLRLAAMEWMPYTTKRLSSQGVASELIRAAFDEVGYQVDIQMYPWKRGQYMVQQGMLDGLAVAWRTEERARTMVYSRPYLKTEIMLIKNRQDPTNYHQTGAMTNKSIGLLRGYGYLNSIPTSHYHASIADSLEQSLLMLSRKRIDLTIETRLNSAYQLQRLPIEVTQNLEVDPKPLEIKDLHLTISRQLENHQQIIDDFNLGLARLIENGRYLQIIDGYSPRPLAVSN